MLGIGTSTGVRVWDTSELSTVRNAYLQFNPGATLPEIKESEEKGDGDDDDDDDDDDELCEVMPPGQGPKAAMAKAEKKKMKEEEEKKKKAAAPKKPAIRAPAKGKKRFAKSKF